MRAGKYAAIEVGGASSLEELWQLLHASEQTGTPCMMLENCCYGRVELLVLNMVRQGVFGELIHCTGGYEHDLGSDLAAGVANGFERSLHNLRRNGDLYPTHALGPLAKILGINRGNRFLSLTSTASKARGFQLRAREQAAERDFNAGDVVTTVIKCANGETIMLTHSVSLPRPYSRDGRVQGTKGIWCEDTNGIYIEGVSSSIVEIDPAGNPYATHKWDPVERFYDSYGASALAGVCEEHGRRPRRHGLAGAPGLPGRRAPRRAHADRRLRLRRLDERHLPLRAVDRHGQHAGGFS